MMIHESHKTRFSDSSLYDEVCVYCGARNIRGSKELAAPCPKYIERLEARIKELEDALRECASDLSDELEGHYAKLKDHPAMKERYERDMASVYRAHTVLKETNK